MCGFVLYVCCSTNERWRDYHFFWLDKWRDEGRERQSVSQSRNLAKPGHPRTIEEADTVQDLLGQP